MASTPIQSKRVCIVGAGPSGLVAAKTFLYDYPRGTFDVVVLEKNASIGGLWPLSRDDSGRLVNPEMRTNISRHSVCFSDFAWPEDTELFPKAWEVGQYLQRYCEKHPRLHVRTSCEVLQATRSHDSSQGNPHWEIQVNNSGIVESHHFDHVVVASGFFGFPRYPAFTSVETGSKSSHSSTFRTIGNVLSTTYSSEDIKVGKANKIVVAGGSMSGAETAAAIAFQLSSNAHSPGKATMERAEDYRVYHVFPKPFWLTPTFLPKLEPNSNASAPSFLPIDLTFWNLEARPPGHLQNNSGKINAEDAEKNHGYLEALLGSDQSELSVGANDAEKHYPLAMNGEIRNQAPWNAVSDSYTEFVRTGLIVPVVGRLTGQDEAAETVEIKFADQEIHLEGVVHSVMATGFGNTKTLKFLPQDVLSALQYDPDCYPVPLNLDLHSVINAGVPDLGFVGFYSGAFWGVMELQSKLLATLWLNPESPIPSLADPNSSLLHLREAFYDDREHLAQFPMGDYPYLMESLSNMLGIDRIGEGRIGPVLPSRYLMSSATEEQKDESAKTLSQVGKHINASKTMHTFVARAIFRALQGTWNMNRKMISSIAMYPSGTFVGRANFHPRSPTSEGTDGEYLYVEDGDFETETGLKFKANRRYAHRYTYASDTLSIWFVKADNKTVDYLFHEFEILPPSSANGGWRAKAHHLCIKDTYDVIYEFVFKGAQIQTWSMKYDVKGPAKDYRIESFYER